MSGSRKHGAHREHLTIAGATAGSAADTVADLFVYDGYATGSGNATETAPTANYDLYTEALTEAVLTAYATLTGQATNYVSIRLTQTDGKANVKNRIEVTASASGVVLTAGVPANLAVASGATVPGAGTGTLTVVTGAALPWTLAAGDVLILDRLSNNSTGLATPAVSASVLIQGSGA